MESAPSTGRRPGGFLAKASLGSLALGYAIYSVVVALGAVLVNVRPYRRTPETRPAQLGPGAFPVAFPSRDGLVLRGVLSPPPEGAPMLVMLHGIGANRDEWVEWGGLFSRGGYGVLAFDWRAHGESEGNLTGLGAFEHQDLLGALDFLESRPDTRGRPIGIVAQSLGAACASMTAPHLPERVRTFVLDSPFGDLSRMAGHRMAILGPFGIGPRLLLDPLSWLVIGRSMSSVSPERNLAALAPRPILVMHGEEDQVIPTSEGKSLYAAYPGPKQSWFVPGARHCETRGKQLRKWLERVAGFLAGNLEGAPPPERILEGIPAAG